MSTFATAFKALIKFPDSGGIILQKCYFCFSRPSIFILYRTVLDVIQAIEGAIPDEGTSLVSKLLELELSIYKSQRYYYKNCCFLMRTRL